MWGYDGSVNSVFIEQTLAHTIYKSNMAYIACGFMRAGSVIFVKGMSVELTQSVNCFT